MLFHRDTTQDLFMVMGALYAACTFLGVNNSQSIQPIVAIERTIFYREKAALMYSPFPYAAAQVENLYHYESLMVMLKSWKSLNG